MSSLDRLDTAGASPACDSADGWHAGTASTELTRARARRVVLRQVRDNATRDELLAMLGLADDQQDETPRGPAQAHRQQEGPHALSAATASRLAATAQAEITAPTPPSNEPRKKNVAARPAATAPRPPATPPAATTASPTGAPPSDSPPAGERRCVDCGAVVVTQTRYRLDREGYKRRGIRLLAAKERCWPCYKKPPAQQDTDKPREHGNQQQPGLTTTPVSLGTTARRTVVARNATDRQLVVVGIVYSEAKAGQLAEQATQAGLVDVNVALYYSCSDFDAAKKAAADDTGASLPPAPA